MSYLCFIYVFFICFNKLKKITLRIFRISLSIFYFDIYNIYKYFDIRKSMQISRLLYYLKFRVGLTNKNF